MSTDTDTDGDDSADADPDVGGGANTDDGDEKSRREHLREMALDDGLDAAPLYRLLYKRRYGEEP